jgi:hypothetical protein
MSPVKTAMAAAAVALVAGAFSGSAAAATTQREKLANASAICTPALPAFEGVIRKRPLAVQNEGTTAAYVTCSFVSDTAFGGNAGTGGFGMWFTNNATTSKTVSCTAVIGVRSGASYIAKSLTLAPGESDAITWEDSIDNSGTPFDGSDALNASCLIQPGVGINDTYVWYQVEVGA